MKFKEIHTFGEVFNGKTPSASEQQSSGLPILKIRDIDENGKFRGCFESFVDQAFYNKNSRKCLKAFDTIILNAAHNADYVGSKNALIPKELDGVIATGEWLIVRPKEANGAYINHFLKSPLGRRALKSRVKGIHLYPKDVGNIKVPLPHPDDQIRIACLLSKVEGLIAQRKQHQQQLDEMLKSIFMEMFGPTNPEFYSWPLVEIRDLAARHKGAMRTGPFGSNLLHSEFTSEGVVAVLGIDNAVQNRFAWGVRRYIADEKYKELEGYRIFPGDVIVTIMGTIGRSAVVPDDIPLAVNTKHLAAITLNRKIANPIFLSYSIHSSPYVIAQFKNKNRGAIMSGLNLTIIKETKIRRPPVERQNDFAVIHQHIDGLKSRYQQSLTELENLYGALSQKAFKGELDLSRMPLPAADNLLPISDHLYIAIQDVPPPPNIEAGAAKRTDNVGNLTYKSFEAFLSTHNGEVFTATDLWRELTQVSFENKPPNFDSFKSLMMGYLDEGRWLEQVYAEVPVFDDVGDSNVEKLKEKKVALRIRDDS